MFSLFRILQRSGGVLAVSVVLLGLAFYGIALLSVAVVDDPARGLRILAVFAVLSTVFCAGLIWAVRKAIARARRPLDSAYEATTRIASMGGKGSRSAFRFLGRKTAAAGGFVASVAGLASRMVSGAGRFALRVRHLGARKERKSPIFHADVIPMRRPKRSQKSGMR
jgi:hypothetical protein